jgi:hypothetical protein
MNIYLHYVLENEQPSPKSLRFEDASKIEENIYYFEGKWIYVHSVTTYHCKDRNVIVTLGWMRDTLDELAEYEETGYTHEYIAIDHTSHTFFTSDQYSYIFHKLGIIC